MVKLSVNVNKIAYLRNSRHLNIPDVIWAAKCSIAAGAHGITVHPRPDERHIRPTDVHELAALLKNHPTIEFNIEGNPFEPPFMELVRDTRPAQSTLVPDSPDAFTSDQGWRLNAENCKRLMPVIKELKELGSRVSLFMDAGAELSAAKELGVDRIELYTEPYAAAFGQSNFDEVLASYVKTAREASQLGLGINAGHDLNLDNLATLARAIPNLAEVSIGHALVADALEFGLAETVGKYLKELQV